MTEVSVLTILLSVAGTVIIILLGVVSFFLKPLLTAIDELRDTVGELKGVVELQKHDSVSFSRMCDMKHQILEKRLNNIENTT